MQRRDAVRQHHGDGERKGGRALTASAGPSPPPSPPLVPRGSTATPPPTSGEGWFGRDHRAPDDVRRAAGALWRIQPGNPLVADAQVRETPHTAGPPCPRRRTVCSCCGDFNRLSRGRRLPNQICACAPPAPGRSGPGPGASSSMGRRGEDLHGTPGLHVERRGIDHVAVDVRGLRAAVLGGDGEAARAERLDAGDAELRGAG
jgi:hypothetical protein